jgi:hypothetical protein
MEFMMNTGYDTFAALYRKSGYNIELFERNVDAINYVARDFSPGTHAIEYRRFLDDLTADNPDAWRRLRESRAARRRAAGQPALSTFTADELNHIVQTTSDIREIRRLTETMNNASAGSLMERWVNHHIFKLPVGQKPPRLRVRVIDNPDLEIYRDRVSDFFLQADNSIWDVKIYRSGDLVDFDQLHDYSEILEAGSVFLPDGTELSVKTVNYIFADINAAQANRTWIQVQSGADVWYLDDLGDLKLLQ